MRVLRTLLFSTLATGLIWAQADRGTIRGSVIDPSGGVIIDVKVVALNVATGVRSPTTSTNSGNYNIPSLPAGEYRVEAEAPGFKKLVRESVRVNAGAITALDLQLDLGATTETVTVTAEAPLLASESSEQKTTVDPQAFADLPLSMGDGRNPTAFNILAPGTKTGTPGQYGGFFSTTFNGGQTLSGEVELDGLSVNYPPAQGMPDAITGIAPEAIQEVSVITSGASAETKAGSGVQRYVIRSGTNEFHGNLYEFLRNDKLDARPFFSGTRAAHRRNEYGGSIGGPIRLPGVYNGTDRSFFFVNYQRFSRRTTPASVTTTVPTPDFKRGDFSALKDAQGNLIQLYDPATTRSDGLGGFTREPFAGNLVPQTRFSQVSQTVMTYIPDPTRPGIVNNFLGTAPSPFDKDSLTMKLDHRFTDNHSLTFSLATFGQDSVSGSVFGDPDGANPDGIGALDHKTARLAHDWIITPTVINHVAFGYNRRNRQSRWRNPQAWNRELGITGMWDGPCSWPAITFEGTFGAPYEHLGRGTGDPAELDAVDNYLFSESLSIVRGKHNIKVGAEARWTRLNFLLGQGCSGFGFSRGETGFPSSALRGITGDSFASFLLGAVNSGGWGITSNLGLAPRWHYYAGYVQDDIKLTPSFTLNLGIRYDLWLPFFDKFDNYSIMDPTVPNPAAGGTLGAMTFAGDGTGRTGRRRLTDGTDRNNLSPHVGFAWTVSPNLVLRAAGGMSYFPSYPYGTGNFRGIPQGFTTSAGINSPDQGITPAYNWDDPFPVTVPLPPFIDPGYNVGQGVSTFYDSSHLLSYMGQWNFNVQYQFTSDWMIDIGYLGNAGNRLVGGNFNANQVHPSYLVLGELLNQSIDAPEVVAAGFRPPYEGFVDSFPTKPTLAQSLRPFPQYGSVDTGPNNGPGFSGSANTGHSTYHSLQIKLQKRLSRGLYMLTSYTLSKKITDADSSWGGFFSPNVRDTYNRQIEKALSPSNPPQRITMAFNYELPIGPGRAWGGTTHGVVGKLLEGWQINGILTYQSGFPLVLDFPNTLPLFNYRNLPDVVAGVDPLAYSGGGFDPATDVYLNSNAFRVPAPLTFGNAPSVLPTRDFPLLNEDFGLMKRTKITERTDLEFRWEVFNAFNRVRFAPPAVAFGTPAFGTVGGQANGARVMQFGLKLRF